MVPQNSKLSERLAALGTSVPVTGTAGGTVTSTYFSIANASGNYFGRFLGIADATSGSTPWTASILKASDAAGAGATAILTTVAASNQNVVLFDINGTSQELNDTAKPFIAIQVASTSGTFIGGGVIVASDGRYDPAQYWNPTTVSTTINAVT